MSKKIEEGMGIIMMENVKKFAEMISADEKLRAELTEKLTGKDEKEQKELLLAFAKKRGFELEESDLAWDETQCESEVDANELSQVAGGGDGCFCFMGGSGDCGCKCCAGGGGDKCGCFIFGNGSY